MALPQLFGIIPTGCPVIITPSSAPTQTSFIFTLPARSFSHIVVFLLPSIQLPPDTAAAVYLALQNGSSNSTPSFKFLGGIGPGKESAVFKINGGNNDATISPTVGGEVDMDAPDQTAPKSQSREMILGISIEASSSVSARVASLSATRTIPTINEPSNELVVARSQRPDTLRLAQKIINNAFNFLASFSGNVPVPGATGTAGIEVVPLKAFEDWWRKFEGKLRTDPGFLERESD